MRASPVVPIVVLAMGWAVVILLWSAGKQADIDDLDSRLRYFQTKYDGDYERLKLAQKAQDRAIADLKSELAWLRNVVDGLRDKVADMEGR